MTILPVVKTVSRRVLAGASTRIGTALAAYLLAKGVPQELADQFIYALTLVASVGLDVVVAILIKKRGAA